MTSSKVRFVSLGSFPTQILIVEEEEDDQMKLERQLALNDARQLKQLAVFFLHPEIPVSSEGQSRCYFDRASAEEPDTLDHANEKADILRDAAALKQAAIDYLHPEIPVVTSDPFACGQNYFERPSAAAEDIDFDERATILAEAKALKKLAVDYMHPELPVLTSDPTACARCFFDRPSGPEPIQDAEEYGRVMEDISTLKSLAQDYLHPERPVVTTDATASARCFFDRASAPERLSKEEEQERDLILSECSALKKLAVDYKHPELPVVTDSTATARCYFDRVSAPERLSQEDSNEMALIMADIAALKTSAADFLHPERPVTSDPLSTARCFFDRPSAPEQLTIEEAEERAQILRDAVALKAQAVDFLHPELPVVTTDPTATARCFFSRPSAVAQLSLEEMEEREAILVDSKALKQNAIDFMHPERSVGTTDPTATARCYFARFSAVEQESKEDMGERDAVLSDAMALKKLAVDYMHPERSVFTTDPSATARCFFDRPSAPPMESMEDFEERLQVLADAKALKKLAVDFMHPEISVTTTCSFATGRNYFGRPSATYHDQMIHTFPPHEHDDIDHHHEHTDHFGMEDFYMGDTSPAKIPDGNVDFSKVDFSKVADDLEGNLSRSPSSVMLYQQEEY